MDSLKIVLDDKTIRKSLQEKLSIGENRLIISELGLDEGKGRADIAVVDDKALWLYEIKGETDTLKRLPTQIITYDSISDYSVLVVAANHLKEAVKLLPEWWGVIQVRKEIVSPNPKPQPVFYVHRKPQKNPHIQKHILVKLLWKTEIYKTLRKKKLIPGQDKSSKHKLIKKLLENITDQELQTIVRNNLRERKNWLTETRETRI